MPRYFSHCLILAALAVGAAAIGHSQECKKGDDACIKKTPLCKVQGICSQKQLDKANGKGGNKGHKGGKKSKKGNGQLNDLQPCSGRNNCVT